MASIKSKYKPSFLLKRTIMSGLFSTAAGVCIYLAQTDGFKENAVMFYIMAGVSIVIMLVVLYNFMANRLESLEITPSGLIFRNGLTRKATNVGYQDILRYGTGKNEHFMGLGTSEGATSIVIETRGGEQFSFSEEEYSNYEELKKAFLAAMKR